MPPAHLTSNGGIRKRGHFPLCIYAPFYTKKVRELVCRVRKPMGSQKQTMKTSRGYAPPAGENSLRGVRYSFDRFSFKTRVSAIYSFDRFSFNEFKFYCSVSRTISCIRKIQTKREVEGLRCKTPNIA